jgi:transcriptional regulator with XRE-family HTH domain
MELQCNGLELVQGGLMGNQKIKNDTNNTIGKNIREARLKAEIGQTELVGKLQLLDIKITRETLVKIERGVQHIQLEQLRGIKEVLGVSYEDLLD